MQSASAFDEYRAFLRVIKPENILKGTDLLGLNEEDATHVNPEEAIKEIIKAPRFYFDLDSSNEEHVARLPDFSVVGDTFLMPSRVVAIEDRCGCALITLASSLEESDNIWGNLYGITQLYKQGGELYMTHGYVLPGACEDKVGHSIRFNMSKYLIHRRMWAQDGGLVVTDENPRAKLAMWSTFCTAARMIALINSPRHWVIKKTDHMMLRKRMEIDAKREPRARTRYIVVTKEEMVRIIRPPAGEQGRQPHFRRAHWRFLRADRYKQKRGQRVKVRSHWVGPMDSEADGARYQVILDPMAEIGSPARPATEVRS
jgi:hypothetical protein